MDGAGAAEGGARATSRRTVRVRFRKEALSLRQVQSPKETVGPGGNMAGRQRPRVTPGPRCGSRGPAGERAGLLMPNLKATRRSRESGCDQPGDSGRGRG